MSALDGELFGPETGTGNTGARNAGARNTGAGKAQTGEASEASVRAGFWHTFKKAARQIPFTEDLVAAYYCALDPETPAKAKAVILGALAYFIMPFDTIPDFLALVGFSDDIAVLTLAIATIRSNLTDAHRLAARKALAELPEETDPA